MKRDDETFEMIHAVHKRCISILASVLSTTLSLIFSGLIQDFRVNANYANVLVSVKFNCEFPQ